MTADVLDLRAAAAERGYRSPLTIGGSEAGSAIGVDPYRSPVMLWAEKTGRVSRPETEAMLWGKLLEPVVFDVLGQQGYEPVKASPEGIFDPERPWVHGHPDGFCKVEGAEALLEIKTAGPWAAGGWSGESAAPAPYLAQTLHYMALTDLEVALLAVLIGGQRLVTRVVRRDAELIERMMEAERDFVRYVRDDVPPPVDGSSSTTDALRAMFPAAQSGELVRLDREGMRLLRELRQREEQARAINEQVSLLKQEIQVRMGDAETAVSPEDEPVVRWSSSERRQLDTKALRAAMPDLAAKFTTTQSVRRFTVL